jgi:hypothetical protein
MDDGYANMKVYFENLVHLSNSRLMKCNEVYTAPDHVFGKPGT